MEIYLFCSIWPIGCIAGTWAVWRMMLWAHGGRDCFRQLIMKDPHAEEWYKANPKQIFFRDSPMANVPYHIIDKPEGDSQHGHEHHANY